MRILSIRYKEINSGFKKITKKKKNQTVNTLVKTITKPKIKNIKYVHKYVCVYIYIYVCVYVFSSCKQILRLLQFMYFQPLYSLNVSISPSFWFAYFLMVAKIS